ncbi:MAG TPA: hypothetical protein VF796_23165 [Humisphaera sp.]
MRSFLSIVAAPALCLGVLGGISWENARHAKPQDAEPFHAEAKQALDGWATSFGAWTSVDDTQHIPAAAQNLLKPNAMFYRRYHRTGPRRGADYFDVLVVQCKTPGDMSGHYPPNCKTRAGQAAVGAPDRQDVSVPGLDGPVRLTQYRFAPRAQGEPPEVIYNFFVLPGRGICPDMADVRDATGDYQRKFFGATQVQVRFFDPSDEKVRRATLIDLLAANAGVLRKLDRPGL